MNRFPLHNNTQITLWTVAPSTLLLKFLPDECQNDENQKGGG